MYVIFRLTAEILEREIKIFYTLFLSYSYKMHSLWLILFVIKSYSHIDIFKNIRVLKHCAKFTGKHPHKVLAQKNKALAQVFTFES